MRSLGYYKQEVTGNWIRLSVTSLGAQSNGASSGWGSGGGLRSSISSGWGGGTGGGGGYDPYGGYTGYAANANNQMGYPVSDSGRMLRETTLGSISWRI
jgi:hypothetical protein